MKKLFFILPLLFAFVIAQGQGAMFLRGSQPAPQPGAGILDNYLGAAFAAAPDVLIYSSHSVTDNTVGSQTQGQTGPYTVLVRRDNDDALRSFTYTEVSDGTLTTWVGPANNGFVQILYDQSTNGNHATQGTAANQPKIVDAGSLVVENGKAALDYNGSTTELIISAIDVSTPCSFFCVLNMTESTSSFPYVFGDYLGGAGSSTNYLLLGFINSSNTVRNFGNGINSGIDANYKDYSVYTSIIGGANPVISRNGNTITLDSNATINKTGSIISIGAAKGRPGTFVDGRMQIIAFYISDQSANRTAIETAINTEYSIY